MSGIIIISCSSETRHEGINLSVDGIVNLELSSKSVGQYESFYNSVKVIQFSIGIILMVGNSKHSIN